MQGVSFLYQNNNPNSDKSTEREGNVSDTQSKYIDFSSEKSIYDY